MISKLTKRHALFKKVFEQKIGKSSTLPEKLTALINTVKEVPSKLKNESIEVCVHLNTDPKRTEQNIKTSVQLSNGWPSRKKILLFAQNAEVTSKNITVGGLEMIEQIKQSKTSKADICVAEPSMEKNIYSIAKILKSTAPNKKYGTISDKCVEIAEDIANNRIILISNDRNMIRSVIGNTQLSVEEIVSNINRLLAKINENKPLKLKTAMIKGLTISTSQSPCSIYLTPREISLSKSV